MTSPEPWTGVVSCDHRTRTRTCHLADRFSITRVQTSGRIADPVQRSSAVPALLISLSLRPIAARDYALWVDGKAVPTGGVPAFRTNVIDLAAQPAMWGGHDVHYAHYHLRRSVLDDVAADLGFAPLGGFRTAVLEHVA